jgi:hypothetical protein
VNVLAQAFNEALLSTNSLNGARWLTRATWLGQARLTALKSMISGGLRLAARNRITRKCSALLWAAVLAWPTQALAQNTHAPELPAASTPSPRDACSAWLTQMDEVVAQHGVQDAETRHIAGEPGLRIDRLAAALKTDALASDTAWNAWIMLLAQHDASARTAEAFNLPPDARSTLAANAPMRLSRPPADVPPDTVATQTVLHNAAQCPPALSTRWRTATRGQRLALAERATVPDNYSDAQRALGLYPLARLPFGWGIARWQARAQAAFAVPVTPHQSPETRMKRWISADALPVSSVESPAKDAPANVPPGSTTTAHSSGTSNTLDWNRDALGLPRLNPVQREALFARHAPVFEIATTGTFDLPGSVVLNGAGVARVDTAAPAHYRRLAYTRFGGVWLPQLMYTIWFSERPADHALDLLSGKFDALTVRLTLDEDGTILLADTIHACGCYHQFFPSARLVVKPPPASHADDEWAFSPVALPAPTQVRERLHVQGDTHAQGPARERVVTQGVPGERLHIRVSAREHQVTGLRYAVPSADTQTLPALPDASLRSLLAVDAQPPFRKSLYGADGIVAGSERLERFFFWPMGIANAGAMRQWGHHATAFLGRRHFDDPDLIDARFTRR